MNKKIILVSGDPNSINSEIIYKSWKTLSKKIRKNIFIISNYKLLKDQYRKLNYKIKLTLVKDIFNEPASTNLKILDVKINYKNSFNVPEKQSSRFIYKSLNLAHKLSLNKKVAGIINCPINKNLLKKKNIGVTEFLASKCLVKKDSEVMIIKNSKLMVSPLTTHLDVKYISKKISKKLIIKKVKIINNWYKKIFKRKPKIGILGLNPHNAELRQDSEERKIIIPAIDKLKKNGILINGPLVSDTAFIDEYKRYNIIVGMYHDQVLSPFKTLFKFDAINLTLGLKYIRVSPDHGVGVDKILLKKSNPESLLKCIQHVDKVGR